MSKGRLREELRQSAPDLAAFIDDLRANVGPMKVTYLKVGDQEFGTPTEWDKCVALSDSTPVKQLRDQWNEEVLAILAAEVRMSGKKRRVR